MFMVVSIYQNEKNLSILLVIEFYRKKYIYIIACLTKSQLSHLLSFMDCKLKLGEE